MILSTFNFNHIRIFVYALISIIAISIFYSYPRYNKSEPEFEPTISNEIKTSLDKKQPDLILIGNSIMFKNINKNILRSELSKKFNRPINIHYIEQAGAYSAWAYLVIKNQILPSLATKAPIGYFYRRKQLTSPFLDFQGKNSSHIEKFLDQKEDVFQSIISPVATRVKVYHSSKSIKESLSLVMLNEWIQLVLFWVQFKQTPDQTLKDRFKIIFRNPVQNVGLIKKNRIENNFECDDFDKCLGKSFLPEIISISGQERLFFVKTHEKPSSEIDSNLTRYVENLSDYLERSNIKHMRLDQRKELDAPYLFDHPIYMTEKGQKVNCIVLADEIFGAFPILK